MTNTAILAVSALLVFAYLLDVFGRRTRLPLMARASFVMLAGFIACVAGFTVLFQHALGLAFAPAALAASS